MYHKKIKLYINVAAPFILVVFNAFTNKRNKMHMTTRDTTQYTMAAVRVLVERKMNASFLFCKSWQSPESSLVTLKKYAICFDYTFHMTSLNEQLQFICSHILSVNSAFQVLRLYMTNFTDEFTHWLNEKLNFSKNYIYKNSFLAVSHTIVMVIY